MGPKQFHFGLALQLDIKIRVSAVLSLVLQAGMGWKKTWVEKQVRNDVLYRMNLLLDPAGHSSLEGPVQELVKVLLEHGGNDFNVLLGRRSFSAKC